jgi:PadR family transcriptional regulator, regulatory protein PadR
MAFSISTLHVFAAILRNPMGMHFGYALMQQTGLQSGTIYPILARLEGDGFLESALEKIDPKIEGRRARRYYTLTARGQAVAIDAVAVARGALSIGGLAGAK